jgi:hypothetical protein
MKRERDIRAYLTVLRLVVLMAAPVSVLWSPGGEQADLACDGDRVVGETFVVAADERGVDRWFDPV